jgi:hypothetical protein
MGGGGSSQPSATSQTVTQSNIPKELMPYAMNMMGRTQALTDINQNPWQQYQGQRFANINPLQQQYMQGIGQLAPGPESQQGADMARQAGLASMNMGRFGQQEAQDYMSPYIQNVLDVQKNEAMRDYARQSPQMSAAAARMGGLGGTRGALMQSEAQRNLQNSLQGIGAKGMQDAYTNAQAQFNADQNRRLQGYGQTIQGGQAVGQLGQQGYEQRLGALNAQRVAGTDLNTLEQQRLQAAYQDFLDQQNYPYKQLGFQSDILRGVGNMTNSGTSSVYGSASNNAATAANLIGGLGSLWMGGKG